MNVDRVMNPDRSELPKTEVIKWVVYGFRDGAYFSLKIRGALPGIRRWTLSLPTRGPVVILQSRTPIRCIAVVMVAWAPFAGAVPGLEACVEIDEDAARLACYDRVAGRAPGRVQPPVAGAATAGAAETAEKIIRIFASNYIPRRTFRGPVFLSGNGLWVDWRENWALNRAI